MTYSEFLDLDDHELKKYLISGCKKPKIKKRD